MTVGIKGERIKDWRDWSAGIGYPLDDGQTPGLQYAEKLLGLRGELRVAPFKTTVTVGADAGHQYQYFFEEEVTTSGDPTFDATSAAVANNGAGAISWSHTVGSNDNRLLEVFLAFETGGSGTITASFEGAALTVYKSVTVSGLKLTLFHLTNPPSGAGTISFSGLTALGGKDLIGGATSWHNVDQNSPLGTAVTDSGTGTAVSSTVTTASGEQIADAVGAVGDVTFAAGADQTADRFLRKNQGTISAAGSTQAGADGGVVSHTISSSSVFAHIAAPIIGVTKASYLYAQHGRRLSGDTVSVSKLSLKKDDFGNLETGEHALTPLVLQGQPVRYAASADTNAFWWFPMGDNQKARRLEVVGDGAVSNDTLNASGTALGADHFSNLGNQVISLLTHSSNDNGGVRILSVDGDIGTEADWGAVFELGDRTERMAGVSGLGGLSWALATEGLFSFTNKGRARLVFEDFRAWRGMFDNIPMVPFLGGMLIPHPTGLLWFTPGELPINVGMEAKGGQSALPLVAAAELRGGRFMGTHAAGGFVWAIYQPDFSSTSVLVLCGYPTTNDPRVLTWQSVGTTTLADTQHLLGVFVTAQSKPVSALFNTPVAWFGDDDDLSYIVLDQRASPFRSRGDTHKVVTSAQAYFSELVFAEPTPLSALVVTTDDMASGDEWQMSLITEGGKESNLASIKADGRTVLKIDRHSVHRLVVRAQFTGTSTADRVPPSIKRVELYATL